MRMIVLCAAAGAMLMSALPASAEVVVRAGPGGVAVGTRHHHYDRHQYGRRDYYHHYAGCRTTRVRTTLPNGNVVVKSRRTCG